jgi:hypothetical protein
MIIISKQDLCVNQVCYVQWGDTEIGTLCNSKDSAHIAANFDTLPSARNLLFIPYMKF